MKKALIIFIGVFSFIVASCGNNTKNNNGDTHTHEDGSTHGNHAVADSTKATVSQEAFKVEADTAKTKTEVGHKHVHTNGTEHKH